MNLRNQAISALESLHQRGDEVDRCNVIRTLGTLKASKSAPILIQALRDKDLDVCIDAAENLGKIGAMEAIPSLIESLENDPDGEVRTSIVAALGEIAIQQIANPQGSKETDKAIEALLKIAHIRPENLEWLGEWDDYWDMQLHAVKALGKLGIEKAVPIMDEIITSDDHQDIESEVLTALAQIGHSGHTLLGERLKAGAARERRRAAQALGHAATPESLSMLAEGLLDNDAEVREATLNALAQRQATQYIQVVLVYLRDPDPKVKAAAIEAIALLGKSSGKVVDVIQISEKLLPLLSDDDPQVRIAALQFIANFSATAPGVALPPASMQSPQAEQFSKALQQAILKMVADPVSSVSETACDTIAKLQYEDAIPDLQLILRKHSIAPTVRRQAALALGEMPGCSPETVKTLSVAIADPQQPVRMGALQALSQLYSDNKTSDESVLETLIAASRRELLEEELDEQGKEETHSLAEPVAVNDAVAEPPESTATETTANQVPNPDNRSEITSDIEKDEGMAERSDKPLSTLDAILQGNAEGEKVYQQHLDEEAAATVARDKEQPSEQSEDDAMQEYYDILDSQKARAKKSQKVKALPLAQDVQLLAIRMLANLGSHAVIEPLLELLQSEDELVQQEATASIEELVKRSPNKSELFNTFGALMNRLEYGEPDTQIHAARALGHLGHPEALNLLQKYAAAGERSVRIAALEGINQLLQHPPGEAENEEIMTSEPVAYDELFNVLKHSMLDNEVGIRIAATEALTNAKDHHEFPFDQPQLITRLIETALQGEGGQARQMGQLLRHFDSELSMPQLLTKLEKSNQSVERRFIIEMIEELIHPQNEVLLSA